MGAWGLRCSSLVGCSSIVGFTFWVFLAFWRFIFGLMVEGLGASLGHGVGGSSFGRTGGLLGSGFGAV